MALSLVSAIRIRRDSRYRSTRPEHLHTSASTRGPRRMTYLNDPIWVVLLSGAVMGAIIGAIFATPTEMRIRNIRTPSKQRPYIAIFRSGQTVARSQAHFPIQ